jgi:hypothetical protein
MTPLLESYCRHPLEIFVPIQLSFPSKQISRPKISTLPPFRYNSRVNFTQSRYLQKVVEGIVDLAYDRNDTSGAEPTRLLLYFVLCLLADLCYREISHGSRRVVGGAPFRSRQARPIGSPRPEKGIPPHEPPHLGLQYHSKRW